MKVKTSELTGPALDWAVAKCESNTQAGFGLMKRLTIHTGANNGIFIAPKSTISDGKWFKPSRSWAQGGPIIERAEIAVWWDGVWHAKKDGCQPHQVQDADRPLIAALRCYVASKLGDEVEIPDELL